MNALRRILLLVYSLLLLAALGGVGALAWNQDEKLDLEVQDLNMQAFVDASDGAKWALTGVLAGIGVVVVFSLLVAVWPHREGKRGTLRIKQSDGGFVEVTSGAIESLLRDELEDLPEVRSAKPTVRLVGGAVDTHLEANIEPSSSIAHATKLLGSTVESVLREHVGVTAIRRPTIRITYDEMAARPVRSARPRPAPPAAEMPPLQPAVYPDDPGRAAALKPQQTAVVERTELAGDIEESRPAEAPRFVSSGEEESSPDDRT